METQIDLMRSLVSDKGIQVNPEKFSAIEEWPKPKSVRDFKSFLGLSNFFQRFKKQFSEIAYPLSNQTRKIKYIID